MRIVPIVMGLYPSLLPFPSIFPYLPMSNFLLLLSTSPPAPSYSSTSYPSRKTLSLPRNSGSHFRIVDPPFQDGTTVKTWRIHDYLYPDSVLHWDLDVPLPRHRLDCHTHRRM